MMFDWIVLVTYQTKPAELIYIQAYDFCDIEDYVLQYMDDVEDIQTTGFVEMGTLA